MKHIKIFEKFESKRNPHVGDYILANIDFFNKKYQHFLNTTIGQIVEIYSTDYGDKAEVEYKNLDDTEYEYMFDTDKRN